MTEKPASRRTFGALTVVTPDECGDLAARRYFLKGIVYAGDHAIAIGQPGAGKSVLGPHIAYAVAQGRSIFGRRVHAGRVLYISAEDGHGMRRRIAALHRRWGDAPGFYLLPQAIDLLSTESSDTDDLKSAVGALQPDLVVLDTLSRSFPGLPENDSEAMGRVVKLVRKITADGKRAVLSIHHVTKDGGGTPRGHGALVADADAVLLVEGSGTDTRTVRITKNRNGPTDAALSFAIDNELLGTDEDGDPITAPIAAEVEASRNDALRAREAKLTDTARLLLRELRNALAEGAGQRISPAPDMLSQNCCARDLLRDRLIASGWFPDHLLSTASTGKLQLTRAGYAPESKALNALNRRGFLAFTREFVWLL